MASTFSTPQLPKGAETGCFHFWLQNTLRSIVLPQFLGCNRVYYFLQIFGFQTTSCSNNQFFDIAHEKKNQLPWKPGNQLSNNFFFCLHNKMKPAHLPRQQQTISSPDSKARHVGRNPQKANKGFSQVLDNLVEGATVARREAKIENNDTWVSWPWLCRLLSNTSKRTNPLCGMHAQVRGKEPRGMSRFGMIFFLQFRKKKQTNTCPTKPADFFFHWDPLLESQTFTTFLPTQKKVYPSHFVGNWRSLKPAL